MDLNNEIISFISDKIGGVVVIADGSAEIMYADSYFRNKYGENIVGMDAESVFLWLGECPALEVDAAASEWEYIDTDSKKYLRFHSGSFEKEGKKYNIHFVSDITEYMGLNRDITKYMGFFKKLSAFQTAVLEKLSNTFYELLPMLVEYFNTSKAYFMIQRDGNMDIITYSKLGNMYSNDRLVLNAGVAAAFDMNSEDDVLLDSMAPEIQDVMLLNGSGRDSAYRKLCSGVVSGQKYAVYLNVWPSMDTESLRESTLVSVIKLYLENGIMKDKLLYESEHDHLTGLYNKGKYLDMMSKEYYGLDSIGIFNLDVNNLKVLNDTKGHEEGDKLLIKAANSIRKIMSNRVHGYRTGGDEFMIVACNITEEEMIELRTRWEKELERLNQPDDGIHCVIAIGAVYSTKEYDLPALIKQADELMYEDKRNKKKPGEEIR